jgi:hypothetical protein
MNRIACITVTLALFFVQLTFADTTTTSSRHALRMFTAAQYDSLLRRIPGGDSIKASGKLIGLGSDATGAVVIIWSNDAGDPVKTVVPAAQLIKNEPAAQPLTQGIALPPPKDFNQNGRTLFILETATKSAFVYPISYSTIFPNAKGTEIGGASLLTVGGMLYASYAYTRGMELGYGKVSLMNYGSTLLGGYYPLLLSTFLHNATSMDKPAYSPSQVIFNVPGVMMTDAYSEPPKVSSQIGAWTAMVGFPLGAYLGAHFPYVDKDDAGRVALMQYFSQTFGAWSFALPVYLTDNPDSRQYISTSTGLAMLMLPAGMWTGYKVMEHKTISTGRGEMPWVTGTMGALTGMGLVSLSNDNNGIAGVRTLLGVGILGYAGGTYLGLTYHPSIDYSYWQTVFIGASSVAGGAVAEAFPLLGSSDDYRSYVIAGIIGSWTGWFVGERLSISLFEKSDRDKRSSLRIDASGLAMLPFLQSMQREGPRGRCTEANAPSIPVASIEWRF